MKKWVWFESTAESNCFITNFGKLDKLNGTFAKYLVSNYRGLSPELLLNGDFQIKMDCVVVANKNGACK